MSIWNATPPDKANIWSFIMLLIDLDPKKKKDCWMGQDWFQPTEWWACDSFHYKFSGHI